MWPYDLLMTTPQSTAINEERLTMTRTLTSLRLFGRHGDDADNWQTMLTRTQMTDTSHRDVTRRWISWGSWRRSRPTCCRSRPLHRTDTRVRCRCRCHTAPHQSCIWIRLQQKRGHKYYVYSTLPQHWCIEVLMCISRITCTVDVFKYASGTTLMYTCISVV